NNLTKISGLAVDSGNGSGVTKIEISITREKDNYYWDGSTWSPLITWLIVTGTKEWVYDSSTISWESGNKYSIQSRAVDFAANCEIPTISNLFLVDTEQPASNIITPPHNNWINYLNTISGTSIDNGGSEINKVEISIVCTNDHIPLDDGPKENNYWAGTKWVPAETWLPVTGSNIFSYDISKISCVTNDHYTIRSRATDNAQNIEVPGEGNTFWFDNQPPEPLNISINYDDLHTNNGYVILSLEADDVGSGISGMSLSSNGNDWSNWELFNNTQSFELLEGDGEKTVYFRVKDYADNIADSVYDIIILDTTPPDNLFIEINDNAKYTNSNNVKLTLRGTDLGSGINEMAFSTDGRSWTPWQPFAQTTDISFPNTNDGKKNVYFKLKDHAGNIAIPVSDSTTLDTEPPYSLIILINNGATETNSTLVTLKLNAVDNTSEPHQISFSSHGLNWSSWEYYVEAKTYELFPGDGKKTVYFKVMDMAGNVAEPVGATILLKTKGEGENIRTTKDSMFSIELWLAVIIIIILFLILIGLIVKPKKRMDQELLTAGTFAVDAKPLPVAIKSTDQIPAAAGPTPLPSTHEAEPVQTPIPPTTTQPQLVKSTQVTQEIVPQVQPSKQPSQAPQIPQLPPAQNQRRYQVQTLES
ncbi:MAG: hypothetical protein KAJ51_05235, partial [Thermoplasmata archaeon]|nr:hypothetical protein [Thermoplasmata archaeon]